MPETQRQKGLKMKTCVNCSADLPQGANFCPNCGKKQSPVPARHGRKRGNSAGSVYKGKNGSWTAEITVGYEQRGEKLYRKKRTKTGFKTKKEAAEYIPQLRVAPNPKAEKTAISFAKLYELWLPTHEASKSTIDCYKAAFGHFDELHHVKFSEIGIDDLQECVDECRNGKRTKQLMKVLATLMYKYAIPRGYTAEKLNFGEYIKVKGEDGAGRDAFTPAEVEKIRAAVFSATPVPYAEYVYCNIYTGYRTKEFVSARIEDYDKAQDAIQGGIKTEAGKTRLVTLSPKISGIVREIVGDRTTGPIFPASDGNFLTVAQYRKIFKSVLAQAGIDRAGLTPYCCRHTFATLLMRATEGTDKEKTHLMGHTSAAMTAHYQHPDLDDLRKITNAI